MSEQPVSYDALGPPLLSVTVAGHGVSPNDRPGRWGGYRQNKAMKESVWWAVKAQGIPPLRLHRARVRVTLLYSKKGPMRDPDNGIASFKPCVDGLVAAGVIVSDSPQVVEWLPLEQHRSEDGKRWTRLDVWGCEP